ncbi:MAG: hypothetical protein JKP96_04780 [Oceanicaulis sp.]|jgi:hypothetical protein|nr:hypothetical protein [Oceanicaulis sp.]
MKGDFSRTRFTTVKHGDLRLQQGRPILDSDWNAHAERTEHKLLHLVRNLVGDFGVPEQDPGFGLVPLYGLSLNTSGEDTPEIIAIDASPSLPFSPGEAWEPFHITLGFSLQLGAQGVLCEIPGLLRLEILADARMALFSGAHTLLKTSTEAKPDCTGKTRLAAHRAHLIHICFDGTQISVHLRDHADHALELEAPAPQLSPVECPAALILGAGLRIDSPNREMELESPLPVTIWHVLIVADIDILSAWLWATGGLMIRTHDLIVCRLGFDQMAQSYIPDLSGAGNDGRAFLNKARRGPEITDFLITPGDLFIQGRLVRNEAPRLASRQPYLTEIALPVFKAGKSKREYRRVYLDVWQRSLTDISAPDNHDPALGAVDTTVEVRDVWQVKWLSAPTKKALEDAWSSLNAERSGAQMRLRRTPSQLSMLGNGLLRVEIHDAGWMYVSPPPRSAADAAFLVTDSNPGEDWVEIAGNADPDHQLYPGRKIQLFTQDTKPGSSRTADSLVDVKAVDRSEARIRLTLTAATPKHQPDATLRLLPIATYKWSTNNACQIYPLQRLSPIPQAGLVRAELAAPGYNGLDITAEATMELRTLQRDEAETPGPLFSVNAFRPVRLELDLQPLGDATDFKAEDDLGDTAQLVCWQAGGTRPVAASWSPLWEAVEIQFSAQRPYRSGEYWTAPLRTGLPQGVDWPGLYEHYPEFLEPEGPHHAYAPLHDIELSAEGAKFTDRRKRFASAVNATLPDWERHIIDQLVELAEVWTSIDPEDLKKRELELDYLASELLRPLLDDVCGGAVRLLGSEPGALAPAPLSSTGIAVRAETTGQARWRPDAEMIDPMRGEGVCAKLAGRPVFIRRSDNTVWTGPGPVNEWRLIAQFDEHRHGYSVAWDDQAIYLVGGVYQRGDHAHLAHNTPCLTAHGEIHDLKGLRHPGIRPAVAFLGDRLYVAGGRKLDGAPIHQVQMLHIEGRRVHEHTLDAPMPYPVGGAASLFQDGLLYLFGGHAEIGGAGEQSRVAQCFDPVDQSWREIALMPEAVTGAGVWARQGEIWLLGGRDPRGSPSRRIHRYDPDRNEWRESRPLSHPRCEFGLFETQGANSRALIAVGGVTDTPEPSARTDRLELTTTLPIYK